MTTKVCRECGCDRFIVQEKAHRLIVVDGTGEFIYSDDEWTQDEQSSNFNCVDCNESYDSYNELVTEQHFHEVIAQEGEEDVHE